MFKFSSLSKKTFLGIDIGTASIKAVEVVDKGGKPMLKNYGILKSRGHLDRLNNAIQTSSLKILDTETIRLLRLLLDEMNPSTNEVTASLPAFSAFTALLDIPLMSREETLQAMQYQVKQFVPLPLAEVAIDWIPVGQYKDDKGASKQQVFLISIPMGQIESYRNIFQGAGLTLKTLEIETLSLARVLTAKDPTTSLIIDIGARSTAIGVAKNGLLMHNAHTDFAGSALTQAISRGLGMNVHRAEDMKLQRGIVGGGAEYEVPTLMLPYMDVILKEAKRVKDVYEGSYHNKVERVILSGGGAALLGLDEYASERFDLPVIIGAPFNLVSYPPEKAPSILSVSTQLTVALGLAINQFTEK